MPVYGVGIYGEDVYGYSFPPAYRVDPFTSVASGYGTIALSWTQPAGTIQAYRLIRNSYGFPVDQDDGTILIDSLSYPGSQFNDTVTPGKYYYYAIYVATNLSTFSWIRSGVTACLASKNFGSYSQMFSLIPNYYVDSTGSGNIITAASVPNTQFQDFIKVFGWGLDLLRTQYDTYLHLNDPWKIPLSDLYNLATQLGLNVNPDIHPYTLRKAIQFNATVNKQRGTESGIATEISALTGWNADLQVGPNFMLENDQSAFLDPAYPLWSAHLNYNLGERVQFGNFWYQCILASGNIGNSPTGTSSSNTWWQAVLNSNDNVVLLNAATGYPDTWEILYPSATNGLPSASSLQETIGVSNPLIPASFAYNSLQGTNNGASPQNIWLRSVARTTASIAALPASPGPFLVKSYLIDDQNTDTATLTSPSFSPVAGELLVIKAGTSSSVCLPGTISDSSGLIQFSRQVSFTTANFCAVALYTATVPAGLPSSVTISLTFTGTAKQHSMVINRWGNAMLAPNPALNNSSGSGAPSATITTTGTNSIVDWCNFDFNGVNGSSRAYITSSATPTEEYYAFTAHYTYYQDYQVAAAPGAQSYGLTAPTGQKWVTAAIEVQANNIFPPDRSQVIADGIPVPYSLASQAWNPATKYGTNDIVTYNNQPFMALRESANAVPPYAITGTATTEWTPISFEPRFRVCASAYVLGSTAVQVTPFAEWYDAQGNFISRVFSRNPVPGTTGVPDVLMFDSFTTNAGSSISGRTTDDGTGGSWISLSGSLSISPYGNGSAYPATRGDRSMAVINAGASDNQVGVTFITQAGAGQTQGLVLRSSADGTSYIRADWSQLKSTTNSGSTWTVLGTYSAPFLAGDRMVAQLNGTSVTILRNGVSVLNVTTSFNQASTYFGIIVENT